jgi:hypothetical protein
LGSSDASQIHRAASVVARPGEARSGLDAQVGKSFHSPLITLQHKEAAMGNRYRGARAIRGRTIVASNRIHDDPRLARRARGKPEVANQVVAKTDLAGRAS